MKALHVMYQCGLRGVGGATAAATRLHLQMLEQGVDSRIVCVWNGSGLEKVKVKGEGEQWNGSGLEKVKVKGEGEQWNGSALGRVEKVGGGGQWNGFAGRVAELRTRWWWFGSRVLHGMTGKWTHAIDLPGFDELVRAFGPDEVHIHWIRRDTISWRQLTRLSCRLYVHLHDLWPLEQKRITSLNPTFVAYSDYVANVVRARGHAVERRNLILDPAYSKDDNSTVRLSPSPEIILFGCKDGRLNPDKGYGDLVKALGMLPAEVQKKIELRIFGEEAGSVRNSSLSTLHYAVKLLGRIDDPVRLREEYRKARCFAFPSVHETMGMTKLEALACGCPVVAFDREACAEGIVHGVNGYVAQKDDIADFAAGLMTYL